MVRRLRETGDIDIAGVIYRQILGPILSSIRISHDPELLAAGVVFGGSVIIVAEVAGAEAGHQGVVGIIQDDSGGFIVSLGRPTQAAGPEAGSGSRNLNPD